jgi:CheY-like chemotaxis protein
MPDGGELRLVTKEQKLTSDPELLARKYIEIAVSDTGLGMSPEVVAKAFEPFFTTKGPEGTGLGLSQVYGTARQAGGTARIESAPQRGTTVKLLLQHLGNIRPEKAELDKHDADSAATPATILVVDDDPDVRQFLAEALHALGYRVIEAEDGYAGLSVLAKSSPDLAIVDYAMPGLTGVEMALELRAKQARLPIIFASGYAETSAIESVLDGTTSVLRKPFDMAKLQDAITQLLR